MKKSQAGLIILVFVSLLITGCEQYDEGGLYSKAEINLTENIWKIHTYMKNDIDDTSNLLISNYTEEYQVDGILIRDYIDDEGEPEMQTGSWSLIDDNVHLKIET